MSLAEKIGSLQVIVEETIDQSKNLAMIDHEIAADGSWSLAQRIQLASNVPISNDYEDQLLKCNHIASLPNISVMVPLSSKVSYFAT